MNHTLGTIRVATYNIHKCRGMDGRVRPGRILEVLQEINADVLALQEVVSVTNGSRHDDQARFLAEEVGYDSAFGNNRPFKSGRYGNLLLTRFPIHFSRNYDISTPTREPRGCLRADLRVNNATLHIFNLHLGTGYMERRHQASHLSQTSILEPADRRGPRIVLGDFNEWVRGRVSTMLRSHFEAADVRRHLARPRTYPGLLPFLHLDHIYFDPVLRLAKLTLFRNRLSMVASDHLPLIADFHLDRPQMSVN
ncbi:MAG: endonuclease/exonuclease/phosphatase family protein [Acidobacteria bacterium]|nr:endonuclease/exonuclease/phosphatase family protein [Acidobacteriota bacterium]